MDCYRVSLAFIAALIFGTCGAHAAPATNPTDVHDYLVQFHKDPKRVMNTPLAKYDNDGHLVTNSQSPLSDLSAAEALKARTQTREQICKSSHQSCDGPTPNSQGASALWAFDPNNQIQGFLFDPTHLTKLTDMEAQKLLASQSPRAPWSDSFWPTVRGLTSRRWLDKNFPNTTTFIDNYNYVLANPAAGVDVNILSPAEKYDRLVGDSGFHLSSANWAEGKATWDASGFVPTWTGICHGWSPAAIMTPPPKRSVTVPAFDGTPITFYPSDIKALISLAYANAPVRAGSLMTYKLGSRCNVSHPAEDDMGRVIDPRCFDINAGAWHMAIVNELGVNKRSFVADTNYDLQIWNYPLYSYKYQYFNPQTFETSTTLAGAAVKMPNFTVDKFRKYRGPDAKYVVGISMEISYAVETAPDTRPIQNPRLTTEKMLYDLELDDAGNIIGGEWYSNFHPAFIWHFKPDGHPLSSPEMQMASPPSWDGQSPIPDSLRQAALIASQSEEPLAVIVERLVALSQTPN